MLYHDLSPPVRDYNSRVLASGLSYVQVTNMVYFLYHLHQCRHCTSRGVGKGGLDVAIMCSYSESRERSIQTRVKFSLKSLNYLPIFFSNSMVDRKVDS